MQPIMAMSRKSQAKPLMKSLFIFGYPAIELPQIVGQLPVLPKHYWTSNGRDISKTTLEPPLGSGPFKIEKFEAGRQVTFARVPDYWARDLNVNQGHYNFDQIRFDYFGDLTVAF